MSEKLCIDGGGSGEVVLDVGSQETEAKGLSSKGSDYSAPEQISNVGLMVVAESSSTSGFSKSVPVSSPSPVISTSNDPSHHETSLVKKKSFSRSLLSKPKSRFDEPSVPIDSDIVLEELSLHQAVGAMSPSRGSYNYGIPENDPLDSWAGVSEEKQMEEKEISTPIPPSMEDDEEMEDKEICKKIIHRKVSSRVLIGWIAFVCTIIVLAVSLTVQKLENLMFWRLDIWKWCMLVLVICCGMLVTNWFMYLVICVLERNSSLRVKVLYFVDEMNQSVQVFVWFALILLTWLLLFSREDQQSKTVTKILHYVTWSLVSAVIGALLWSVKVLLVKILESNFYVNAFFDRAHDMIFYQHILRRLSTPLTPTDVELDRTKTCKTCLRVKKVAGKEIVEVIIDVRKLLKMKQENISGWTKKVLVDAVSTSELSSIYSTSTSLEVEDKKITSESEAVQAASDIYSHVASRGDIYSHVASRGIKYMSRYDLLRFLDVEEMHYLFMLTNTSELLRIKKRVFRQWMERPLHLSFSDTKLAAIKRLDKVVTSILLVITILVWLVLLEIATTKVLLFMSSQLVLAVFIFGNTCKTVFEAIMFLFVVHPFDVGDRCVVDGTEMIVEEMNILTTVFVKLNNDKVYYPNSVLSTLPISNCQTNTDSGDKLEFSIRIPTVETLNALKSRVKTYIESRSEYWNPNHDLSVTEIDNGKLKMALSFDYNTLKFHESGEKTKRRSQLIIEWMRIFEDLNIKCYFMPPQEVYVNKVDRDLRPSWR